MQKVFEYARFQLHLEDFDGSLRFEEDMLSQIHFGEAASSQ